MDKEILKALREKSYLLIKSDDFGEIFNKFISPLMDVIDERDKEINKLKKELEELK